MDKRKSPIIKSNSTSEAKKNNSSTQKGKKECRSSAEFMARLTVTEGQGPLKRRGLYVEKKSIKKIPITNGAQRLEVPSKSSNPTTAQSRVRRPDKKRFLTNVLDLLSKSTAGTQTFVPEKNEPHLNMETAKQKMKKRKEEVIHRDPVTPPLVRKKPRIKCKSVNRHVDNEIDSLIVLQSTKEITQTPSNNSECITPFCRKAVSTDVEPETTDFARPHIPTHRQDVDLESETQQASHSKNVNLMANKEIKMEEIPNRIEKNIYNLFVNVLKTTLSACDINYEFDGAASRKSSQIHLEIDESVAKKLNMVNMTPKTSYEVSEQPSCNTARCLNIDMPIETTEWDEPLRPQLKKQYKIESVRHVTPRKINMFQYRMSVTTKPPVPKTKNVQMPSKKKAKRPKPNKQRDFIDSLKQELQFHQEEVYEKPSFFQALKEILVRNKRQQSVKFWTEDPPSADNICQLKCRRVLSAKSSRNKPVRKNPVNRQAFTTHPKIRYRKRLPAVISEKPASLHSNYSLEVVGYDNVQDSVDTYQPISDTDEDFSNTALTFDSSYSNLNVIAR